MAIHKTQERNALIDSLRAIALAGVIVMNMMTFSGLAYLTPEMRADMLGTVDWIAWSGLRILIDGKALAAFSFMFGFSFSLIIGRMTTHDGVQIRALVQRLLTLFLIGLFNAVFLFWADILMTYAALGLILPFAARLPARLLAGIAGVLILAGPAALAVAGLGAAAPVPRGHIDSIEAFASPVITDVIRQNLHMMFSASESANSMLVLRFFTLSGLFLLGLAAGKSGALTALLDHRGVLLRLGAALALTGLAMKLALRLLVDPVGLWALLNLHTSMMALGYLMLVAAALSGGVMHRFRRILAPLGKMTLTGYLMSAALGQMVFYGWGLGMIGQLGTMAVIGVVVGVYALLLAFAHLWFRHFLCGPWEWLWRSLTTLRPQPFLADRLAR
ncbi:MAG: DUF418 domain-containing protein [Pararhodobacter sp.]